MELLMLSFLKFNQNIFSGTLLQEVLIRSPSNHLTCIVMDTNEMIHVEINAVEELNEVL